MLGHAVQYETTISEDIYFIGLLALINYSIFQKFKLFGTLYNVIQNSN